METLHIAMAAYGRQKSYLKTVECVTTDGGGDSVVDMVHADERKFRRNGLGV